jgi:hypothetical protein
MSSTSQIIIILEIIDVIILIVIGVLRQMIMSKLIQITSTNIILVHFPLLLNRSCDFVPKFIYYNFIPNKVSVGLRKITFKENLILILDEEFQFWVISFPAVLSSILIVYCEEIIIGDFVSVVEVLLNHYRFRRIYDFGLSLLVVEDFDWLLVGVENFILLVNFEILIIFKNCIIDFVKLDVKNLSVQFGS